MKSPADMRIIQIDITNACPHKCSNCTRFTSHINHPYMMEKATFERAVASLEAFPRMVGIMGGEPTIHPQFEAFVRMYAERIPGDSQRARQPIVDFNHYRNHHLSNLNHRRGLWSSLGPSYYKHFELIQDTFPYQCINDHQNPGLHQALLVKRKELGIDDDQWLRLRDACWLQNQWSASITPKGAFFCEVAGALDLLFDGPGGWPIEPGWWERKPEEFGDQLKWCELCGAALSVPRATANAEIDLVSPEHAAALIERKAPSVNRLKVIDLAGKYEHCRNVENYLPSDKQRVSPTNASIKPKSLVGMCVCSGFSHVLQWTLPGNVRQFDRFVVVSTSNDSTTHEIVRDAGADLVISDRCWDEGDAFNKGRMLNDGWAALDAKDWVVMTDADIFMPSNLREYVMSHVLNPGCMYYTRRLWLQRFELAVQWAGTQNKGLLRPFTDIGTNGQSWGYFQLINVRAQALRRKPTFSEAFCGCGSVDGNFRMRWPNDKRLRLAPDGVVDVVHIPHAPHFAGCWNGPRHVCKGWRWAGQLSPGRGSVIRLPNFGFVRLTRADTAESVIRPRSEWRHEGFADCRVGLWFGKPIPRVGMEIAWREELP